MKNDLIDIKISGLIASKLSDISPERRDELVNEIDRIVSGSTPSGNLVDGKRPNPLTESFVKSIQSELVSEKISYGKFVELLNSRALEWFYANQGLSLSGEAEAEKFLKEKYITSDKNTTFGFYEVISILSEYSRAIKTIHPSTPILSESEVVYRKVSVKERLPKEAKFYYTNIGIVKRHIGDSDGWIDTHGQAITHWLEPIQIASAKEGEDRIFTLGELYLYAGIVKRQGLRAADKYLESIMLDR